MTSTTLAVEGMSCSGCESNIRFALTSLAGVRTVTADHVARTVSVEHDPELVDRASLVEAIEAMGYESADR
ncbi:MAG: heavy-metal-associated domain-containing protein [Acidimicrobiales bacterium]